MRGVLTSPKSHQRRRVEMSPQFEAALSAWRRALRARWLKKGEPVPAWISRRSKARRSRMRDVAEHIDDYALDQGRQKAVARQPLEVSTMEADGPTLCWLQARLNAREASQSSRALFAAVKEASQLFRAGSPT